MEKNSQERYFSIKDVERAINNIILSHSADREKSIGDDQFIVEVKPSQISDEEIESAFERAARRVRRRGK